MEMDSSKQWRHIHLYRHFIVVYSAIKQYAGARRRPQWALSAFTIANGGNVMLE